MMYFDTKIRRSTYMYVLKYFPYKTHIFACYMCEYVICCCVICLLCVRTINMIVLTHFLYAISDIVSCVSPDQDR